MSTRIIFVAFLTLAAAGAQDGPGRGPGRVGRFSPDFQGARILGAEAGMPGRVVKNAPYSADLVTETTQTLADGNHIRQSNTAHLYRDSEGRTRREESLGGLGALAAKTNRTQVVFINDPVGGVNYALNPGDKTANKSMWARSDHQGQRGQGQAQQGRLTHPPHPRADSNVKTESLGTQTIEGVTAQGTRTTFTIPAGSMGNEAALQIVNERWYSADLQAVVLAKRSDPRSGDTVTKLTNISRSEPSPTLFQVPSDFKVSQAARPRPGGGAGAQQ